MKLFNFLFSGHSAKFGSCTIMDLHTNTIVDMQLIQVGEIKLTFNILIMKKNLITYLF